jgi:hypothetical protein
MTSFRQIEANRRNALKSTGPTTEDGKRRSRQNALRHGLSAETVVEIVEDIDDYKGFEAAVIADYERNVPWDRCAIGFLLPNLFAIVPAILQSR